LCKCDKNSTAKLTISIAKLINSIANGLNSIVKVTNSTAKEIKSIAKVTKKNHKQEGCLGKNCVMFYCNINNSHTER